MNSDYLDRFGQVSEGYTPVELLENWNDLIEVVEDGYGWNIYELDTDISTDREPLEGLIRHPELCLFPEHKAFKEALSELDSRFKKSVYIRQGIDLPYWWQKVVLKQGRSEYCHSAGGKFSQYRIKLVE